MGSKGVEIKKFYKKFFILCYLIMKKKLGENKNLKMQQNKRIALISLYSFGNISIKHIYYSLLNKGYDVYCIYFCGFADIDKISLPTEKDYNILIGLLKDINPQIVGITLFTGVFNIAVDVIKRIRNAINPLILMGGIHAIIEPEECMKYADVVCIWEGDESVPELCDRFFQGKDYSNVPNLWVKKDNRIIKNHIKPVEDLDNLPMPDFESKNFFYIDNGRLLSKGRWELRQVNERQLSIGEAYLIMIGRGCPYRCTFCVNSTLSKKLDSISYKGKYIKRRSINHIIEELKLAKKHFGNELKLIKFLDDILCMDADWLEKFIKLYKKEINIPFWCQMHFSSANERILFLLKEGGVRDISFGLESGSEKFRREVYHKYFSNEKVHNTVKIMKEREIPFRLNLILNNPLETDEDLMESVRFLLSLRPFNLILFSLTNYPKTELTERLKREGLIKEAHCSFSDILAHTITKYTPFKDDRNRYWFYIFNFISKAYIPKFLITFLTKDIFVKHPRFLIGIFDIGNNLYQLKEKLVNLNTS